jgi:hypothetical protein
MSTITSGPDNNINDNSNVSGVVTDSLQVYYDAGRFYSYPDGGHVWRDLSGNGRDMAFYCLGGTTYSANPPVPPTFTTTRGGEITLDGVNDFGYISSGGFNPGSTYTISLWLKTSATGEQCVLSWCNGGPVGSAHCIINDGVRIWYYYDQWYTHDTPVPSINDGNWHYVVWAVAGTDCKVYVDNNLVENPTLAGAVGPTIRSISGRWGPCNSDSYGAGSDSYYSMFNGQIGVVMVHSKRLTDTEVEEHWEIFKRRFGI